ncbi:MAG: polyprenol monophosphomannose synthase [Nocardioidaceae bacterium]|nr:polyprenol monophosphomannose synthase [Nocardioidaceae bacterium]
MVVIPTYDEAGNVERVVDEVRRCTPEVDVLIVDDASPDGTGAIADAMATRDPHIRVLHRASKQGLGVAYGAGFRWGLARDYELFVQMDGDGSHSPRQLPALLQALTPGTALVLGSRWVAGGTVVDWPPHRELLSRGGNRYARLALGTHVRDCTGGYRVYRRGTLEHIDLDAVRSQGYCFQVDMLRRTLAAGGDVVEVPITFVERQHGESKMSLSIVAEALWRVTWWRLHRRPVGRTARTRVGGA